MQVDVNNNDSECFRKINYPPKMGEVQVDNLIKLKLIYVDISWSLTAAIAISHSF